MMVHLLTFTVLWHELSIGKRYEACLRHLLLRTFEPEQFSILNRNTDLLLRSGEGGGVDRLVHLSQKSSIREETESNASYLSQ